MQVKTQKMSDCVEYEKNYFLHTFFITFLSENNGTLKFIQNSGLEAIFSRMSDREADWFQVIMELSFLAFLLKQNKLQNNSSTFCIIVFVDTYKHNLCDLNCILT